MVSIRAAAACVVVGLACVGAARAQDAPRSDQEVLADRVVDHGWGFELVAAGKDWQRLGEADARRMQPEAVAAVMHLPSGVPVFAIVSERHGRAAHEVVQARVDGSGFADKQVVAQGPTTVAGRDAEMFELTGRWESYRMRFAGVAIERGEHVLELISFGTFEQTGPGSGYARWDVLRLLGDAAAAPGRAQAAASTPDRRGVGWRVRDGVLESAVCGVRLRAVGTGMRLATGLEARMTLPGAEAALADDARQLAVALVPARPLGGQAAEVAALTRELLVRSYGAAAAVTTFTLAAPEAEGGVVAFEQLSLAPQGRRLEVAVGVVSADGAARVQLMACWQRGADAAGRDALARTLGALEVLDEAPLEALARELEALPDPESKVTDTLAYRRGLLRSFEHDLTFARPARGLWRVTIDREALAGLGGGLALLEAPLLGLQGWISVHRQRGYSADSFHAWAVRSHGGRPLAPPVRRRAPGAELRVSWLEQPGAGDLAERLVLATAVAGERLVTVAVSGAGRDLEAERELVLSVFDGLTLLDRDLRDFEQTEAYVRDERLGFELRRPAEGWTLAVGEEQATIGSHGRVVKARDAAGHQVEVLAVSAPLDAVDPRTYEDYLLRMALRSISDDFELRPSDLEKGALAGTPCRRLRAKIAGGRIDVFLLHREGVSLVLGVFDPDGEGPPLADLQGCLELLD